MTEENSIKSRRIAKNTIVLYFRMIFLMLVQLYTTRVIINALGDTDYGIFNVVGGVVVIFSVASRSIGTAISRFLAYGLGEGDEDKLQKVFSTSVWMLVVLAAIVFVAMETMGLWFVNYHLTIPVDRMVAANWVFQMSILSFLVSLIISAYNALIVAHERMSAFAYYSIFDALMKLGIAYLIVLAPDRLILYAILILFSTLISALICFIYCKSQFSEARITFHVEKDYVRQMFGFTSWSFVGALAHVMRFQGIDIVLNMFFGPLVNAAKSIAFSVSTAVNGFIVNLTIAVEPQIIKSYASGNVSYEISLISKTAKYSFFLYLIIATPVFVNAESILNLWLGHVPDNTVLFCRLLLIQTAMDVLSNPMGTGVKATGKIKWYETVLGLIIILNIPISYYLLYLGCPPESVFYSSISLTALYTLSKWCFLRPYGFSLLIFFKDIMARVILVSFLVTFSVWLLFDLNVNSFNYFLMSSIKLLILSLITIVMVGLDQKERLFMYNRIKFFIKF